MLGSPSYYHKTNEDNIFDIIEDAHRKNYIMVTTATPSNRDRKNLESKGIISLQSYSILNIVRVPDRDGNMVRIIQLRNPWGSFEWNGDWSDFSLCWTEEAMKIAGLNQNENDGMFWMNEKDYQ